MVWRTVWLWLCRLNLELLGNLAIDRSRHARMGQFWFSFSVLRLSACNGTCCVGIIWNLKLLPLCTPLTQSDHSELWDDPHHKTAQITHQDALALLTFDQSNLFKCYLVEGNEFQRAAIWQSLLMIIHALLNVRSFFGTKWNWSQEYSIRDLATYCWLPDALNIPLKIDLLKITEAMMKYCSSHSHGRISMIDELQ